MSDKLLLIADEYTLGDLRARGDLPLSWLRDLPADSLMDRMNSDASGIIRCQSDWLIPPESPTEGDETDEEIPEEELLDAEERKYILASLQDVTVFYLAVIDPRHDQAKSQQESDGERAAPVGPQTLAEHVEWYRQVRAEIDRHSGQRAAHVRHVMVLVFISDPDGSDAEILEEIRLAEGTERLFDQLYVMLESLEPGQKAGQVFFSKHVWPMAVSSLLIRWLLDPETRQDGGSTSVFAWRAYSLVPKIDQDIWQRFCVRNFDKLTKQLNQEDSSRPDWDMAVFQQFNSHLSGSTNTELELPFQESSSDWLNYQAAARLDGVRQASRWETALRKAGLEFQEALCAKALKETAPEWKKIEDVWRAVHSDPFTVQQVLRDRQLLAGPDVDQELHEANANWEKILELDVERADRIEAAEGCVDHIRAAQDGFVGVAYRVGVVFVVTLCLGYLAMVTHVFVEAPQAAIIACSGGLGGLIAAFLFYDQEMRAGRRAQREYENQLKSIDDSMKDRHKVCEKAINSADLLRRKVAARAAANRLKQLLRRTQFMLDDKVRYRVSSDVLAVTPDADVKAAELAESSTALAGRQRNHFRAATQIPQEMDTTDVLANQGEEEVEAFVERQADELRSHLWPEFCNRHDLHRAGHLPARDLMPLLEEFCDIFQTGLLNRVRSLAVGRMSHDDKENWQNDLVDILQHQSFFELMSCRVLGHQTAGGRDRRRPTLFLREEFHTGGITSRFKNEATIKTWEKGQFEELPYLGVLFEEMPVAFEESNGQVTIAPYPVPNMQGSRSLSASESNVGNSDNQSELADHENSTPQSAASAVQVAQEQSKGDSNAPTDANSTSEEESGDRPDSISVTEQPADTAHVDQEGVDE